MKYVIIGGVAAGMSAAMEIKRTDKNAHVTVLEKGADYSYGQCGLPYLISGKVTSFEKLYARSVETFREKYNIDARVWTTVKSVDFTNQFVKTKSSQTNEEINIPYDKLLIASGSSPVIPDWEGKDLAGIHTMGAITDTNELLADLKKEAEHITIIGGGYIGLEAAENLVDIGKKVTLIQRGSQIAKIFDEDMAKIIEEKAKEKGINLILNEEVKSFKGDTQIEGVETDKQVYKTDLALLAIGVKPNTEFLKDTNLHLTNKGVIIVDAYQQTNINNVYAAGDCATHYHRIKKINDHIPLGTTANKQGRIAGANMSGHALTFNGIVGTSIIKFFDLSLGRTGISEKEAKSLNIPYKVQKSESGSHAGYYPGSEKLYLKIIYHQETRKLLGGQIIGKAGVDKRIDVLAVTLFNEMSIDDLIDLDLAYAPPYNGVWDPIQQIARKS